MVRRCIAFMILMALSAACQSLQADDIPATMQTDLDAYSTEVAMINGQAVAQRTESVATIQAASTLSADYYHYNNQLVATVKASIPSASSQRIAVHIQGSGGGNIDTSSLPSNVTQLAGVGLVSVINTGNCFDSQSTLFNVNEINVLYFAVLAANMQVGTRLSVDWDYEGQVAHQSEWIAPNTQTNLCVDIPIRPGGSSFAVGQWGGTLFVDGQQFIRIPFKVQ